MRAIMKSVSPRICEKVANGDCTILVSKTAPKCEVPFKCYIYCTYPKKPAYTLWLNRRTKNKFLADGKVIGEFVCDRIDEIYQCNSGWVKENACISKDEFFDYLGIPRGTHFGYDKKAYAWHISDLKIYDKPKQISDFLKPCPDPYQYCTICKHCVKIIPPDEEEYALYHGGHYDYCEEHCMNILRNPPKGWCYVEEL